MIYIIDHQDSFTQNVVHQFENFDNVVCDNYNEINKNKLNRAKTIVLSPGPGAPKNYPISSSIYKKFNSTNHIHAKINLKIFQKIYTSNEKLYLSQQIRSFHVF